MQKSTYRRNVIILTLTIVVTMGMMVYPVFGKANPVIYLPLVMNPPMVLSQPVEVLPDPLVEISQYGYLDVSGEVKNNSDKTVRSVQISANLFDANHSFLRTTSNQTVLRYLEPDQKTCFEIGFSNFPNNWKILEFEDPTYQVVGNSSYEIPASGLTIIYPLGYLDSWNWYHLTGQIRNDGNSKAFSVRPVGTLYNSAGKVIGCDSSGINSTDLDVGQTSSFDISFYGRDYSNTVANFRIQVEGRK